jgi:hypothetical protein
MLFAAGIVLAAASVRLAGIAPADLPERLTGQQFLQLSDELSEPNGSFQSDNLLSNEIVFGRAIPELVARVKPGGVYLGVGPEQNFTYIAALKPKMVFITDIRRGNLHLHLMYKALFELSANREEFVSRLFTKPRPATALPAGASANELMAAFWDTPTSGEDVYFANLRAIQGQLTSRDQLKLTEEDLAGIARVYRAFYWYGPGMTYSANTSLSGMVGAGGTSYRTLMAQADATGQEFSYLSSEEKFNVIKDLESRNLIVPVVGNFAGPKALRAVGAYVRDKGAVVSAFYLSNVESYLRRDGTSWPAFCASVATFPLDATSVFIRPSGSGLPIRGTLAPAPATFVNVDGKPMTVIAFRGDTLRSPIYSIADDVKACAPGAPVSRP